MAIDESRNDSKILATSVDYKTEPRLSPDMMNPNRLQQTQTNFKRILPPLIGSDYQTPRDQPSFRSKRLKN